MLGLVFCGVLLWCCTLPVGYGIMAAIAPSQDHALCQGDRVILASWLGLLSFAVTLLGLSLWLPLKPWLVLAWVLGVGLPLGWLARHDLRQLQQQSLDAIRTSKGWVGLAIALYIWVAIDGSQLMVWYDTGLYHSQQIQWLHTFGTVPGLALLHHRFGVSSAWFALLAILDHRASGHTLYSVANTFVLGLAIAQLVIVLHRLQQRRACLGDGFLVVAWSLVLPQMWWSTIINSTSPDLVVILLTIVTAWAMLISHDTGLALAPLLLGALTFSIKPSSLPITGVAFLFYLWRGPDKVKRSLLGISLIGVIASPLLIANVITSGYLLFPSTLLSINVSWLLTPSEAHTLASAITNWARWASVTPLSPNPLAWVQLWLDRETQLLLLWLLTLLFSVDWWRSRSHPSRWPAATPYLLLLGLGGSIYVAALAPAWRFGWGMACLMPALGLARWFETQGRDRLLFPLVAAIVANSWLNPSTTLTFVIIVSLIILSLIALFPKQFPPFAILGCVAVLSLLSIAPNRLQTTHYQLHPVLPPSIAQFTPNPLIKREQNGLTYSLPSRPSKALIAGPSSGADQCWTAPLPCTPHLTTPNLTHRNPQLGVQAGFQRTQ
ncbi:hypothetical protein PN441_09740 [Spirulina major CS-329]|uniref:LIC_10190 family membrane protein n=1 Tax=Spirulina TaxID=1154 RepID=UPI00232FAD19|nr:MULTISPECIES: hypothetical protein [Spirulina]MDB9496672.1 hypothetical protein [Spirulina subsalsa CS-330]MDB9503352.1 hypothetical protein [Spirulina major CS-329]